VQWEAATFDFKTMWHWQVAARTGESGVRRRTQAMSRSASKRRSRFSSLWGLDTTSKKKQGRPSINQVSVGEFVILLFFKAYLLARRMQLMQSHLHQALTHPTLNLPVLSFTAYSHRIPHPVQKSVTVTTGNTQQLLFKRGLEFTPSSAKSVACLLLLHFCCFWFCWRYFPWTQE